MMYALSSEDIYNFIMRDDLMLRALGGIYPLDKLPSIIHPSNFCFINSDPAFLPGRHWICVFFPDNAHPEFFDSLGRYPSFYSNSIPSFMGGEYSYNSIRLQPPNSSTCGLYCLYFIYFRVRGNSYIDILKGFSSDLEHNNSIVIDFYRDFG